MKNNNGLIIAILAATVVLGGTLVYLGTQVGCDSDALKAAVIDGVAEYVEGPAPAEQPDAEPLSMDELIDDDAVLGDPNAPVTIVEFSEYQCPYCSKFYNDAYQKLKEKYVETGKVKLVFRDFPLSFHEGAYPAALAAECVRDQAGDEGYFAMHDKLFENQDLLSGDAEAVAIVLEGFARDVEVDPDVYKECMASDKFQMEIFADASAGQAAGVSGTPSFLVNGILLVGAQPFENFEQIIEAELAK